MLEVAQIRDNKTRLFMSLKRTVRQRFFNRNSVFLVFFTMTHNDRGYGHPAACGRFSCREATKLKRAQMLQKLRQPAGEHRRVLAVRCFLVDNFLPIKCAFSRASMLSISCKIQFQPANELSLTKQNVDFLFLQVKTQIELQINE